MTFRIKTACDGTRRFATPIAKKVTNIKTAGNAICCSGGRYHGGRRPSVDDSPTVITPSALDKPSITKRCHRRHTSSRLSRTMVTLHDTRFVEWRWLNGGWTVKTVVTWRSWAWMIPAAGVRLPHPDTQNGHGDQNGRLYLRRFGIG